MNLSGRHSDDSSRRHQPSGGQYQDGKKTTRQKITSRQLVSTIFFLAVSWLLLAAVIFFLLTDIIPAPVVVSEEGLYLAQSDSQTGMILIHDQRLRPKQAADFKIAMAKAGISGDSLYYDQLSDHSDQALEIYRNQIRSRQQQLSIQADLSEDQIWLLFQGRTSELAREFYSETGFAGMVLIDVSQQDGFLSSNWSVYPVHRPLVIFASANHPLLDESLSLFEQLTGEDARLFQGARAQPGSVSRRQFRSADGFTALYLHDELNSSLLAYDFRLASDLAFELTAFSDQLAEEETHSEPVLAYTAAGMATVQNLRFALLILIGLIAVPFAAGFTVRYRIKGQPWTGSDNVRQQFPGSFFWVLRPILIWIPSLILWLLLLWVGYSLAISDANLRLAAFLALPGCYGLVSWIAEWIRLQKTGVTYPIVGSAGRTGRWSTAALLLLSVIAYWVWRYTQFGLPQPGVMTAGLTAIFVLWHIPGLCLEDNVRNHISKAAVHSLPLRLLAWLSGVWPYLLINLYVYVQYGKLAGLMILIMLIMLGWATQAGRLLSAVTGRSWAGQLLRAGLLASAWLNPIALNTIFH